MKLGHVVAFVRTIDQFSDEYRRLFNLAFFNPTDAAAAVAQRFIDDGRGEEFSTLVDTAVALNIENAERVERATFDVIHAHDDDVERCPGCGCGPGDGLTAGCSHPEGCGYWKAFDDPKQSLPESLRGRFLVYVDKTNLFLTRDRSWTADPNKADSFSTFGDALNACRFNDPDAVVFGPVQ